CASPSCTGMITSRSFRCASCNRTCHPSCPSCNPVLASVRRKAARNTAPHPAFAYGRPRLVGASNPPADPTFARSQHAPMAVSDPTPSYPILEQIHSPADLRAIPEARLDQVCEELRDFIIDVVSVKGGHFGASLGVVELTVALHYVFNTPYDQLVWDVGHQAYGHKILTGRRETFHTNRLHKGLSGFPKRSESAYDTFGVGHSSTSIGAALGMDVASRLKGEMDRHTVAVIGDGAMTAGMAFEALNHAGTANTNLLVVLNYNCMSIDPNVRALKEYLTDITTSR